MDRIETLIRESLAARAQDVEPTPALYQQVQRKVARRQRWRIAVWTLAGATAAMRAGAVGTAAAMLGVALLADGHVGLLVCFALAGAANGLSQPGTNLAIALAIPARHRSLAMGLKQTAGPTTSMLAGLAVPAIGLTLGWRWAFALTTIVAVLVVLLVPNDGLRREAPPRAATTTTPAVVDAPLLLLAVAVGTAMFAGSALGAFYVESAVAGGVAVSTAGTFMAVGGVMGILGRISAGWLGGRTQSGHLRLAAAIMAGAAVGHLGVGFAGSHLALLAATVLTFASGWGYYSLFIYAVIHLYPHAPSASTGVVHTGAFAGGVAGPITFGAVVEFASHQAAWSMTSMAFLVAAGLMLMSDRLVVGRRAVATT
jgi:predicted MFS family arabinose efflux permease